MSTEIKAAVKWLIEMIAWRSICVYDPDGEYDGIPVHNEISLLDLANFGRELIKTLKIKYENHWYDEESTRDQAYRAIHISPKYPVNEFFLEAAKNANVRYEALGIHDMTLTIWIDPGKVTGRYADNDPMFVIEEW